MQLEKLRGYKATHEARFTDIAGTIERAAAQDLSKIAKPKSPQRLKRLASAMGWTSLTEEETSDSIRELNEWIAKLGRLSADKRGGFLFIAADLKALAKAEEDIPLELTRVRLD